MTITYHLEIFTCMDYGHEGVTEQEFEQYVKNYRSIMSASILEFVESKDQGTDCARDVWRTSGERIASLNLDLDDIRYYEDFEAHAAENVHQRIDCGEFDLYSEMSSKAIQAAAQIVNEIYG